MNTITKIAVSNNKKNKVRSILVIVSVMLTTMLLTIITNICYGSVKSNIENSGLLYGNFYGIYHEVNLQQLQNLQLRSEFNQIGLMSSAGKVDNNSNIYFYWVDDTVRSLANLTDDLEEGAYPQKSDEIAGDNNLFEKLGYHNSKIGDKINLKIRINNENKYEMREFVICGLLKENKEQTTQESFLGFISEEYYNQQITEEKRSYSVYFDLNKNVEITSSNAEEVLQKLGQMCGIEKNNVSPNIGLLTWKLNPGTETIAIGVLIAFCVMLFSVIVIYNIFQVGIVQKIQEYGKIKAFGGTRKQLKQLIFLEGILLGVLGVPGGILLGCIVSKFVFIWGTKQSHSLGIDNRFMDINIISIPLLLLVVLVSLLTVYLAIRKPMKIVAEISPMEALRFQENAKGKRQVRKGKKAVGVKEMMFANMLANKKRMIMSICTMGLSCVLFVILANFAGNMDSEYEARQNVEYGQFLIRLDYSLNDLAYPENNLDCILKKNPLGSDLISAIRKIDGVTEIITRKFLVMREEDTKNKISKEMQSVGVINKEEMNKRKEQGNAIGVLDYEKAASSNGIIFGTAYYLEENGYALNQKIKMKLDNGDSQNVFEGTIQGAFGSFGQNWAITEDSYKKLGFREAKVGYIWVDCEDKDVMAVRTALDGLLSGKKHIKIKSYEENLRLTKTSMYFIKVLCYGFLAILGVIGFMNMANTMIVSIITRKQEIGVLQAIGMTNRQLNHMLQMEGIIFTIGTVFIAMIVGVPGGYALFSYGKNQGLIGLHIYHFPIVEIIGMIIVIALLQMLLSYVLSKNIRKESLIERIRYQE